MMKFLLNQLNILFPCQENHADFCLKHNLNLLPQMNRSQKQERLPKGFLCSGITAGLKENADRKDLGLIYSENEAVLGAVYTQNKFPSAHVQYCRQITPTDRFRALIVNSGNANTATGQKGLADNLRMASQVAKKLNIGQEQVLTSSTGIIGRPFPINKIERSLDILVQGLDNSSTAVSEAIMTTDLTSKTASAQVRIGEQEYSVVGFSKGSGMIHPNMATMLAYVLTDAPLPFSQIQTLASEIADNSLNCLSVDGDTSTNDSFYLISSNPVQAVENASFKKIKEAISQVAISLTKQIAADGEGAEHLIEVRVLEGSSEQTAHSVLNEILTSSLVKTAINGKDPNWGRILMAAGNSSFLGKLPDNHPISISIQSVPVFSKGEPVPFDETSLSKKMEAFEVLIEINLHNGKKSKTGWGCDFSKEYIAINADYST